MHVIKQLYSRHISTNISSTFVHTFRYSRLRYLSVPQALGTEGGGLRLTRGFVRELRVATWHRGLDQGWKNLTPLPLSLSIYLSMKNK